MVQRVEGQVDVEVRPPKMPQADQLDVRELPDGSVLEPGKLLERQKPLLARNVQPEAV